MKNFKLKMRYLKGDLVAAKASDGMAWEFPRMCASMARKMFDLPTVKDMKANALRFIVTVSDRKSDEAVKLRKVNKHSGWSGGWIQIQMRNLQDTRWSKVSFYCETEEKLKELFELSGKKYLYVTISEA